MYVVFVYDTAAERNPKILRPCRQYLHHVQRSVFEGALTPAQLRRFHAADVRSIIVAGEGVIGVSAPGAPLALALPAVPVRPLSAYAIS